MRKTYQLIPPSMYIFYFIYYYIIFFTNWDKNNRISLVQIMGFLYTKSNHDYRSEQKQQRAQETAECRCSAAVWDLPAVPDLKYGTFSQQAKSI